MKERIYSLEEAADVADVPLDELRQAIRDGLLRAELFQNTGEYHIGEEELARYVKRTRHLDPFGQHRKKKVLVLGEDLLFAGTIKLELERDPRLDVRYASWGKDAVLMVNHYGADLFVVDLTPSRAVPDEVLSEVAARRAARAAAAVAYFTMPEEALGSYPLVQSRLVALSPQGYVSKTKGLRALTLLCYKALGLETNTQIFRLHG